MTLSKFIKKCLGLNKYRINPEKGLVFLNGKPIGCVNSAGYNVANLTYNKKVRQVKIARMVWIYTFGIPKKGFFLDHINRIRHDDRIKNLRLVTPKMNSKNRRSFSGIMNPNSRYSQKTLKQIVSLYKKGMTRLEISKKLNVNFSSVSFHVRKNNI